MNRHRDHRSHLDTPVLSLASRATGALTSARAFFGRFSVRPGPRFVDGMPDDSPCYRAPAAPCDAIVAALGAAIFP
jgi:hypothetical protein